MPNRFPRVGAARSARPNNCRDAQTDAAAQEAQAKRDLPQTEDAIRADQRLGDEQKAALIAVYRSMLGPVTPRES